MALNTEQRARLDRLMRLQNEAKTLGLAITVRCVRCGLVLSAAKSVATNVGPTCRRHNKEDGPGSLAKDLSGTV